MATISTFQSDVLLGHVQSSDLGYSFKEVPVLWDATTTGTDGAMAMGAAVYDNSGTFTWAASANVADVVGVIVDPLAQQYDEALVDGQTYTMVIAVRGATIAEQAFTLAGTTTPTEKATAIAAFEAAGANTVSDKLLG
ncbi:MAG: hypothetical protein GY861_10970 [bacterium]|nr:hypothetical protein [bacterium]